MSLTRKKVLSILITYQVKNFKELSIMSEKKMTNLQKIIAYTAIVTGIIAIFVTFATSIHIMYHFYTGTSL